MPAKKKKTKLGEITLRNIKLDQIKKEIDQLKDSGKEHYKPKIGRLIRKLQKKKA